MVKLNSIRVQDIEDTLLKERSLKLDVLRLDTIHETVSGNKWFKLKYYLEDARQKGFRSIVTYGGAYSNHIIAAAFACREYGFACKGIIRGEKAASLSHTLQYAESLGMQLHFVSREDFRNKNFDGYKNDDDYEIAEGGRGISGAKGASEILQHVAQLHQYSHIICATGTGTMLAGLIQASLPGQLCTGISVMKNNFSLHEEVMALLPENSRQRRFAIVHDYHFGGYAKYNNTLIDLINNNWRRYALPLDFVYTAKTFFAIKALADKNYFDAGSSILMIHSGGLQGNLSLPPGTLYFP